MRTSFVLLSLVAALGCGAGESRATTGATDPEPTPPPQRSEAEDAVSDDEHEPPGTALAALGITVALPEEAIVDELENPRADIRVGRTLIRIQRVDVAPPTTLEEAVARTPTSRPHRIWAQGTSPSGVFYVATTFQTREGFRDGDRHVHHLIDITRVYGTLPIDEASFIECTVYIEAGRREDPEPPDLVATGIDICASMQPTSAGT